MYLTQRLIGSHWTVGVLVMLVVGVTGCVPPPSDVPEPEPVIVEPVPDDSEVVRGFADLHNHLFSDVGFGGRMLCGEVFDPAGIAAALQDCPEHYPHGELALFENLTQSASLVGEHDPVGWPTFADWPAHGSLTHQQNYYEWVRRAWEGGLRVMVNQLVTNRQLCDFYPFGDRPCDEMDSIRSQAELSYELQDFIDGQYGGAGRGWFRIVEDSAQARAVIAEGKLAVILGVETSEPFGCKTWNGRPACTEADVDRGLDELHDIGVRSMFLCHKFDNALCGVRFDEGAQGLIINIGNKLSTNRFWRTEACPGAMSDNTVFPEDSLPAWPQWLISAGDPLPLYGAAPHCNARGLTDLGAHAVQAMIDRNMIVEVDHMSVKAAGQTLDLLEAAGYPGVVSSHSWADPGYFDRIYELGGMVASYGNAATGFVEKWERGADLRAEHGIIGYGVGIDANGFGGLPPPREDNGADPVTYPFRALDGHLMDRARTGPREWDVNVDGMAHYGLLPDWIEDMRTLAGDGIVEDLAGGAEQYLRTLEAAESHPGG